ncbi:uncharacterized protein LOC112171222 [Rosa chinensis]|uniref:uncharacterized protein LOC112171222 n=1 Tax=Rosa chinensis TaxID=74649 RepID=UPI000D08CB76|nr:uncharacterized protein LOC112171222 [Rosa chinensis]
MATFRRIMTDCGLMDMGFIGSRFTWSNKFTKERLIEASRHQLLTQQEKYWRQRSRAIWLKDGDRNLAYFHRRASNRRSRNLIRGLVNEQNVWQSDPHEIQRLLMSYFQQVFSTKGYDNEALSAVIQATPVKVTKEMNEDLMRPYTDEEIKGALFQMHPSKSSGPDGLSALIAQAVNNNRIQGLTMCHTAPTLHHLFFADDGFLFGTTNVAECISYRNILDIYERAFGQKVNFQKSSVVFSNNVSMETQLQLAHLLAVKRVHEHDRYLGLPLRVGKSKTTIFEYIKEKFTKKLFSWKAKILNCAGKEILIKAVAQTMSLYAMNCYLLPKSLCDDIYQLCASFFWGDTDEHKKIHWRSWDRMCLTKQEGGMGFKNIYAYNLAMLAKKGWRIVTNPDSLIAKLYKARYFPYCSFWEAELGDSPLFSWRSCINGRPVLKARVQWKIGDGK